MLTTSVTIWSALLAFGAPVDEAVFSGPQPGERLPPLRVVLASAEDQRLSDLAAAAVDQPTLLVFVNGANRPAARLTRVLMNYAETRANDGLFAAIVWLDDDRSEAQRYLRRAFSWWGVGPPVGVSIDGADGPGSYGLNRNINVTVLVADKNQVTANFALIAPNETDASRILARVVELIGGDVPTKAEVLLLSMPTRKPADAKWPAAPQDVQFRRLLCALLSAKNHRAAESSSQAIEQYVRGHAERKERLAQVAKALGKGRTNVGSIPAASYLRRWRTESNGDR